MDAGAAMTRRIVIVRFCCGVCSGGRVACASPTPAPAHQVLPHMSVGHLPRSLVPLQAGTVGLKLQPRLPSRTYRPRKPVEDLQNAATNYQRSKTPPPLVSFSYEITVMGKPRTYKSGVPRNWALQSCGTPQVRYGRSSRKHLPLLGRRIYYGPIPLWLPGNLSGISISLHRALCRKCSFRVKAPLPVCPRSSEQTGAPVSTPTKPD